MPKPDAFTVRRLRKFVETFRERLQAPITSWIMALLLAANPALGAPGSGQPAKSAPKARSLFARSGGKPVLQALVANLVDTLAADPVLMANSRLRAVRDRADRKLAKKRLFDRVCEVTGGPCKLRGPIIKDAPEDLELRPQEWLALLSNVNTVLTRSKVPSAEQRELVTLLISGAGR